MTILEQM